MIAPLGGEFSYSTNPKLQPDVFFKAVLRNSTDYPVLPGTMSVYVDNSFIGKSKLPSVLPNEKFDAYLGIDDGIRVERKLVNRKTGTSGLFTSSRVIEYEVQLLVHNLKKTAHRVTVVESLPVALDERIKVSVRKPAPDELAPDKEGIMTWQLQMAPGERRVLVLDYTVEMPASMSIGGLD